MLKGNAKKVIAGSVLCACVAGTAVAAAGGKSYTTTTKNDGKTEVVIVTNPNNGATLGYSKASGVKLLERKEKGFTYAFKDLNKNGKIDEWEDWTLPAEQRAKALSKELSVNQMAGLMLFSSHERAIEEGLTDAQRKYLKEDNLRNVLNAGSNNVEAAVQWNNAMQAYVEALDNPIPVNFSSDPRSTAGAGDAYSDMIHGNSISLWPSNLGLAATFDPSIMYKFAKASSAEYRAMGISTALGPQIDLATEPRWGRVSGTFGEGTKLAVDMTQAYVDGSQSSYDEKGKDLGWGVDSINCMIKHWPGDGAGEAGRESHSAAGKYAVYPGNNYSEHLKPFTEGGFKLKGKTKSATAVMDSYSIGVNGDGSDFGGQGIGSAYNKQKMDDLRKANNFAGVVCTDWAVTSVTGEAGAWLGTAWGAEGMTIAERHLALIKNGVDMFGGNNDAKPVVAAYEQFVKESGEEVAKARYALSAERILTTLFKPGLFENPYLEMDRSKAVAGSADKRKSGYEAQLDSVVMLKNAKKTIAPASTSNSKDKVAYIPMTYFETIPSLFGAAPSTWKESMSIEAAKKFYKDVITDVPVKDAKGNIVDYKAPDLSKVDVVIIGMRSPYNGDIFTFPGMKTDDKGNRTFYPLSLQYKPYTASLGREVSLGGDFINGVKENRAYNGNSAKIYNTQDLECFDKVYAAVKASNKEIPIVVVMKATNAMVFSEFENRADSIVMGFGVSDQAYLDVVAGNHEPRGLLPIQMPANMETVEKQLEDVGRDLTCHVDTEGNTYDFAYGMNYKGVINDKRVKAYK